MARKSGPFHATFRVSTVIGDRPRRIGHMCTPCFGLAWCLRYLGIGGAKPNRTTGDDNERKAEGNQQQCPTRCKADKTMADNRISRRRVRWYQPGDDRQNCEERKCKDVAHIGVVLLMVQLRRLVESSFSSRPLRVHSTWGFSLSPNTYHSSPSRDSAVSNVVRSRSGVRASRRIMTCSSGVGSNPSSIRMASGPRHSSQPSRS